MALQLSMTITKSELCALLGCNEKRLRRKFVTDQVIRDVLKIDVPTYRRIREFDVIQTRALYRFFKFIPAEE